MLARDLHGERSWRPAQPFSQAAELAMEGYHCDDPYWRVRYQDGDWEELNHQDVKRGKDLATARVSTGSPR